MEPKIYYNVPSASQGTKKSSGIIQFKSKDLRTKGTSGYNSQFKAKGLRTWVKGVATIISTRV